MKKNIHRHAKIRTLALKKETIILTLAEDRLKHVAGGNKTTVLSQCPTECF